MSQAPCVTYLTVGEIAVAKSEVGHPSFEERLFRANDGAMPMTAKSLSL
jgi:hypothetical protein